jgi:hypothetical protein
MVFLKYMPDGFCIPGKDPIATPAQIYPKGIPILLKKLVMKWQRIF